jgi:Spy/CpxP family protein refolding chaperone
VTWWSAAILLGATVAVACASHYSRGADGHSQTHHGFFAAGANSTQLVEGVDEALDHVDATQEQRAKAKAIVARYGPRFRQLHQERQAVQQQLLELWDADEIDLQAVSAARARCERLARESAREGLEFMNQLMGVLTVQQRREVVARWGEHAA